VTTAMEPVHTIEERVSTVGAIILRYGLAAVIAWIGALKFTGSEALRIQ
jgi:uncharacterized membrane protein YkgB